jgi:hypothetical protein
VRKAITLALAAAALAAGPALAAEKVPVTLRGSPESMKRQNAVAKENDLSFVRTRDQMRRLERAGKLVRLEPNGDFTFAKGVSGPVARPEVRTFVERLSSQYRDACGERLVVTSLTRPSSNQPGNSHPLSVHPAGIAVDLRISRKASCRAWLEGTLLSLEGRGVLDITREARPPHYHVALFPEAYRAYVERRAAREESPGTEPEEKPVVESPSLAPVAEPDPVMESGLANPLFPAGPAGDGESSGGGWPLPAAVTLTLALCAAAGKRANRREG